MSNTFIGKQLCEKVLQNDTLIPIATVGILVFSLCMIEKQENMYQWWLANCFSVSIMQWYF